MANWLEDLLGKRVMRNSTILPDRKVLQIVQGAGATVTVADDSSVPATVLTISAGGAPVSPTVDVDATIDDNGSRYYIGDVEGISINLPDSDDVDVGYTLSIRNLVLGTARFLAQGGDTIRLYDGSEGAANGQYTTAVKGYCTIEWTGISWLITESSGTWDLY